MSLLSIIENQRNLVQKIQKDIEQDFSDENLAILHRTVLVLKELEEIANIRLNLQISLLPCLTGLSKEKAEDLLEYLKNNS